MGMFEHLKCGAKSDTGRRRKNNEDNFRAVPEAGVFCVADGMGGGDDGEVASDATVRAVEDFCRAHVPSPGAVAPRERFTAALKEAVDGAGAWIFQRSKELGRNGCGTTFAGVVFHPATPGEAVALHAGDSRVYRIHAGKLKQITRDHSAAELIGAKSDKDVNPMFRGVILRAVGVQDSVELEETPFRVKEGDRVIICSDGLDKMVDNAGILKISGACRDAQECADALVAAANAAGGVDNVTVVAVDVGRLPKAVEPTEGAAAETEDGDTESTAFASVGGGDTEEIPVGQGGGQNAEDAEIRRGTQSVDSISITENTETPRLRRGDTENSVSVREARRFGDFRDEKNANGSADLCAKKAPRKLTAGNICKVATAIAVVVLGAGTYLTCCRKAPPPPAGPETPLAAELDEEFRARAAQARLAEICATGGADAFLAIAKSLLGSDIPQGLEESIAKAGQSAPGEDRAEVAAMLCVGAKQVVWRLAEFARSDGTEREGLAGFLEKAAAFADADSTSAAAQEICAEMIENLVPECFK